MQKTFGYFYKMSHESFDEALQHHGVDMYESVLLTSKRAAKEVIEEDKEIGIISKSARPKIFKLVAIEVKDE